MAGKSKKRIDYAGWSVDIFSNDIKIDKLLDAHGWIGFGVYFYLCQMAFGGEGYYYEWGYDLCASTARKMGGGVGSGTVKETVDYCLQIGLFDKGLFDGWGVLTSRGIQKSYLAVVKGNSRRTVEIYKEYWLLDISKKEDCQGVVFIRKNSNKLVANGDLQGANAHSQGADDDSIVLNGMVGDSSINNIPQNPPDFGGAVERLDYDRIANTYNTVCKDLPKVRGISDERRRRIRTLLNALDKSKVLTELGPYERLEHIFRLADESDFLSGRKQANAWCGFDWLINSKNALKVIEGNYRNGGVNRVKSQQGNTDHSRESENDALAAFRAGCAAEMPEV